jgi:hypothetical protein
VLEFRVNEQGRSITRLIKNTSFISTMLALLFQPKW